MISSPNFPIYEKSDRKPEKKSFENLNVINQRFYYNQIAHVRQKKEILEFQKAEFEKRKSEEEIHSFQPQINYTSNLLSIVCLKGKKNRRNKN